MPNPRLLLLFPKGTSSSDTEKQVAQVRACIKDCLSPILAETGELVSSDNWFNQSFAQYGDWDSWIWETVNGKDFNTREHHFKGYVVVSAQNHTCGRATASISSLALRAGRPVLHFDGVSLRKVLTIDKNPSESWIDGWSIDSTPV